MECRKKITTHREQTPRREQVRVNTKEVYTSTHEARAKDGRE
jgi:hypothetical protein